MKIDFRVIAHGKQRYPTVGDYFCQTGTWAFRVSRMRDQRYHWLVFLHEVIEWAILRLVGVPISAVNRFDMRYEGARATGDGGAPCGCAFYDEPGNDPHAPYHRAHQTATACEKLIAEALGVNWSKYDETVESL